LSLATDEGERDTMIAPTTVDELQEHLGEVGASAWRPVSQEDVDRFADATGDHQWIHIDVARARETPLGGTIAHGFYTLSLAPRLLADLISFEHFGFAMNYGLDRVRFVSPLPVGDRVRMRASLDSVTARPDGADVATTLTFERAGGDRPVCVAQLFIRVRT
jgi:acyl dehydratase